MGQIRKLLSSLTLRQQISIVVAMVAVGVGLWLLARWNHERDFVPLYSNLSAEDAGAVMAKLKEENVEYRVDGNSLRVPSDKVAEIRLRMPSEALPKTSRIAFALVRPHKDSAEAGGDQAEADLEYRQKMERDLVLKIGSTLEPLLGAEKFRAGASVEVDFTSADQSEETFDPSRSAMVTAQKTEDVSGATLQAGIPGTASNLPRPQRRAADVLRLLRRDQDRKSTRLNSSHQI